MEQIILNSLQGAARNIVYYHNTTDNYVTYTLTEPCDYLINLNGGLVYTTTSATQQGVILSNNSVLNLAAVNSMLALPAFWIIRGPNGLKIKEFVLPKSRVAAYWL